MFGLSEKYTASHNEFRAYVDEAVFPYSNEWEERGQMPGGVVRDFAARGYFGAHLPELWGGRGMDSLEFGLLAYELARGSVSLLSMLTVHNMTSQAVLRFGTDEQKSHLLRAMASGEILAAFALTEPEIGSDASKISTESVPDGDGYILNGAKKWISFSQWADIFLVIARCPENGTTAFLIERETPGLQITPMSGLLGFRAAGVSELSFRDCRVGKDAVLGNPGGGFSYVASYALDHGRYTVGWGGAGVINGCVESCAEYARNRIQFDQPIRCHQLIQAMIADMATDLEAAVSLAMRASASREAIEPDSIMLTSTVKYFASKAALRAASDAVQIHGGNGCGPDYPVQRYFRDAKICEIIEGSSQMQQLMISRGVFTSAMVRRRQKRKHDER